MNAPKPARIDSVLGKLCVRSRVEPTRDILARDHADHLVLAATEVDDRRQVG